MECEAGRATFYGSRPNLDDRKPRRERGQLDAFLMAFDLPGPTLRTAPDTAQRPPQAPSGLGRPRAQPERCAPKGSRTNQSRIESVLMLAGPDAGSCGTNGRCKRLR